MGSTRRGRARARGGLARAARQAALALLVMALTVCCQSPQGCTPAPPAPDCPDLQFSGRYYDEWREFEPGPVLQELGDATYPACNDDENCGPDLGGFATTDVWLLDGVKVEDAVLGYRQDTETHVIFVRRGADPDTLPGLPRRSPD